MKPIGQEPDEVALMDALAYDAKTSGRAFILHSQFKNAVGRYKLGIIDRDEYLRVKKRIMVSFYETEFQVGDIVEILNLDQAQSDGFHNPQMFVGMRYRIESIWPAKSLLQSDDFPQVVLSGFPLKYSTDTTFFKFSQLRLYYRELKGGEE